MLSPDFQVRVLRVQGPGSELDNSPLDIPYVRIYSETTFCHKIFDRDITGKVLKLKSIRRPWHLKIKEGLLGIWFGKTRHETSCTNAYVCAISYIYPVTCGPRGHGSSSATTEVVAVLLLHYPFPVLGRPEYPSYIVGLPDILPSVSGCLRISLDQEFLGRDTHRSLLWLGIGS